jgi:hypothetical protein
MSTQEEWLSDDIVYTIWTGPLTNQELASCFEELVKQVKSTEDTVHLLFNIANAGSIPLQAPTLFLRSRLFSLPNLGQIAVFGMNPTGQILGRIAATMTSTTITFFDDKNHAIAYLHGED